VETVFFLYAQKSKTDAPARSPSCRWPSAPVMSITVMLNRVVLKANGILPRPITIAVIHT
jgi:hypothetical protein